jgi:hypothetical protein
MDDKDNKSAGEPPGISQIPLLNEIVFESGMPLQPPTTTRTTRTRTQQTDNEHGPDYDPDTLDLFEEPAARLQSLVKKFTEEELRAGADQMIENLVAEFSAEITRRLRDQLGDQLRAILEDLNTSPKEE